MCTERKTGMIRVECVEKQEIAQKGEGLIDGSLAKESEKERWKWKPRWWMKPSERETRTRGVGPGWGCIATSSGHWHAARPVSEGEKEAREDLLAPVSTDATYFVCRPFHLYEKTSPYPSVLSVEQWFPSGWNFSSVLHVCRLVSMTWIGLIKRVAIRRMRRMFAR